MPRRCAPVWESISSFSSLYLLLLYAASRGARLCFKLAPACCLAARYALCSCVQTLGTLKFATRMKRLTTQAIRYALVGGRKVAWRPLPLGTSAKCAPLFPPPAPSRCRCASPHRNVYVDPALRLQQAEREIRCGAQAQMAAKRWTPRGSRFRLPHIPAHFPHPLRQNPSPACPLLLGPAQGAESGPRLRPGRPGRRRLRLLLALVLRGLGGRHRAPTSPAPPPLPLGLGLPQRPRR